jgi:hypothetical protein
VCEDSYARGETTTNRLGNGSVDVVDIAAGKLLRQVIGHELETSASRVSTGRHGIAAKNVVVSMRYP